MSVAICGIDPGLGGGIAFWKNKETVSAVKMPQTNKELWDYFEFLKQTYGPYIVFLERVSAWKSDKDTGGKSFGIDKMLNNYNSMIALIEANNIPLVEVSPITWQKQLELHFPAEKKKLDPSKYKQFRKNKYKRKAAELFPTIKPTLRTADALCVLRFGIERFTLSPKWVKENTRNKTAYSLFSH
tara:strand:+ start:36894 stop:37448 length:555 start_codon:yes stop_codon:yes gene_type:complete